MTEFTRCPKCGCQLTADAPAGLCPKCLIKAGFESQPLPPFEPGPTLRSPASEGFQPPSVKELAGRFPHLEILELLGKGGMGAVYKARQTGLDRLVAVKILPPEVGHDAAFTERFTREARALARLSHNSIVSVYDFGQADGLSFIVMEFVDGVSLRQMIQTGTLTAPEALAIVPQICEALQFAHDEGIVHRDIKPENILIDKRGRVKIADFGLAKMLGADATGPALTATHQVMGTMRYMAPEQLQGSRVVDHRADIYSLGVVFYELLTGELPMGRFAPPSRRVEVDVRLDEIVLRALEQEPALRYQHASEVKTDVESISRESRKPNPAVQNPASRDGGTPRAELQSLPSVEPRFSRMAIAGAIWAPLFFIAVGASMVTQVSTGEHRGPAAWQLALAFTLLPLGALAPFGTTILGAAAVAKINRSRGRLYGLGLAAADILFFPLLAINAAIFGVLLYFQYSGREMKLAMSLSLATAGTALFGGWVSSMIIRRVWGVISGVTEEPGERDSFGPRKDEERTAALTPPSSPLPRTKRPKLVPVIAVFNLVGAILLMLICAMEEQAAFAMPIPKLWQVWEKVDAVLGFGMAAGVFAASIGLFLWKPWARELTLVVCIFGLASVVFDAPYLARFALPGFYAEIQQTLIAEGVDPVVHPFMSLLMIVCFFGGMLAVCLTWMIGQLVYFTRPRVVAAFESDAGKKNVFFSWLFTGTGIVVALLSVFGPLGILLGITALLEGPRGTQTVDRSVAKSDGPFVSGIGVATTESSSGWTMGEGGPELTDLFARVVLRLSPSQIPEVNTILQEVYADYIEIEAQQIEPNTDDAGHIVVRINPSPGPIAELENRLWSQLDTILDPSQQSIARLNLELDPPEVQPPIALNELVRPGFFGWGKHGASLEIWRVGTWFHWKIQTRGYEDAGRAPELPDAYRRFWIERTTTERQGSQ